MAGRKKNVARVIAGEYRGRALEYPRQRILRPTMARTRESVMGALDARLPGAVFADLYAGAGGVGIEALSRGAAFVYFVEDGREPLECLARNLARLGVDGRRFSVEERAVGAFLGSGGARRATIVYADPPYGSGEAEAVLAHFDENRYPGLELLVIEHGEPLPTEGLTSLRVARERRFGETTVSFFSTTEGAQI